MLFRSPELGCRRGAEGDGRDSRIGKDRLGTGRRIGKAAPGAARLTCPARHVALKRFETVGHYYASFSISSTSNLLFPLVRLAPNPISEPTSSRVVNVV